MSESLNPPAEVPELTADEIQARVLHRDGLMPAGLPVHRGPKGGANLESSFDALRFGLPRPPVLAHRLDRDTSGCLVLGRHRKATASLGLLFKHGRISKTYWAVVEAEPAEDAGTINMPLGRLNAERGWWQKPDPQGQQAVTKWKVLGRGGGQSWLALEPVTGRTHQLRVHAAAMGWPIVGDNIYGATTEGGPASDGTVFELTPTARAASNCSSRRMAAISGRVMEWSDPPASPSVAMQ